MENHDDELMHYGKKGMKWGKRTNPNYTSQQIHRDIQVYGARGAKRINKMLNEGDQISTARSYEKTRRDNVIARNKYVRQTGKIIGGVTGAGVGIISSIGLARLASSRKGQAVASKLLGNQYGQLAVAALNNPIAMATISAGSAKIGTLLSGDIAVGINMRANGYNPNRKY